MEKGFTGYTEERSDTGANFSFRIFYEQGYSIENNQSTVTLSFQIKTSGFDGRIGVYGTILVNGQSWAAGGGEIRTHGKWITTSSQSFIIDHTDDGTQNLEIKFCADRSYDAGNFVVSGRQTGSQYTATGKVADGTTEIFLLKNIPRGSEIKFAENVDIGSPCSISWDVKSSSLYYKLKFYLEDWTHETGFMSAIPVGPYVYNQYVIPIEVANRLTNSTRKSMHVELYTYTSTNSGKVSTSSSSFIVHVPSSYKPSLGSLIVNLDNSSNNTVNSWGIALSSFTALDIMANGSGVLGSSVTSYILSCNGAVIELSSPGSINYNTGEIDFEGDYIVDVYCIDTRGRSSNHINKHVTFLKYKSPYIKRFSVHRNDINKTEMIVDVSWVHELIGGRNSSSATLYYKEKSAMEFLTYGNIQNDLKTTLPLSFDENKSYNFKVVVTDLVGEHAEKSDVEFSREVLLNFKAGGKGLAIGKISEIDAMEVAMDARFFCNVYINDKLLVDYLYPIGSVYMNFNPTSPADLFGGSWERISERFLYAASDTNPMYYSDLTGGEEMHTLTKAEMPRHDHNLYMAQAGNDRIEEAGFSNGVGRKYTNAPIRHEGGSQAHNNMPPYITIYMWRRVG